MLINKDIQLYSESYSEFQKKRQPQPELLNQKEKEMGSGLERGQATVRVFTEPGKGLKVGACSAATEGWIPKGQRLQDLELMGLEREAGARGPGRLFGFWLGFGEAKGGAIP